MFDTLNQVNNDFSSLVELRGKPAWLTIRFLGDDSRGKEVAL